MTSVPGPGRGRRGARAPRSPTRGCARSRSRRTTCPAVVARLARAGLDANVVSRGEWAAATARRRAQRRGSRSRGSARTRPTCGPRSGRPRPATRRAGWPSRAPRSSTRSRGVASRAGLGRDGRPPLDVLFRLNPDVAPETHAGLAVGHGSAKFGMTETELTGAVARPARGRAAPRRAASISTSGRSSARWTPGGTPSGAGSRCSRSSARAGRASTRSTSAAASRSAIRERCRRPARFAREVEALLAALPPDRRARPPRGRARAVPRRARRLAPRVRAPRPGAAGRRADRRARRRHDRAHPPGAVRGAPPDRRPDVARAPGRARRAAVGDAAPASTGRSARAPTPSTCTTCRRCGAATSSRSRTPAPTPPRWR